MDRLSKLELRGFKSIRDLPELSFGPLNVLIGANGAGKSNLFSFLRMLGWMVRGTGELQDYVAQAGGAGTLLFDGPKVTRQIQAGLTFASDDRTVQYRVILVPGGPDALFLKGEGFTYPIRAGNDPGIWRVGSTYRETALIDPADRGDRAAVEILRLIRNIGAYQFHDTSPSARIRQRWNMEDSRTLKEDGANLAPFLLRLRQVRPPIYRRIVRALQGIMPFFSDFVLDPVGGSVILQWRERASDMVFGAHQASDGMLRVMSLLALLLQPEDELPSVIILDEPELGLHPYAINVVAGLLQSASTHAQVILATQSVTLVDYFQPEEVIVVDRANRESHFRRLDPEPLKSWLDEYSLGELWEKNVLGGRPA